MKCASCKKQKQSVSAKKSAIWPGTTFLMCDQCKELKYEPRALIIIVARSKGSHVVREHLNKKLYVGPDILGTEITP